ncbi:hypothetical protein GGP99_001650 [Salinibacter ruber]|uniref:Uncharacterized protein n=1 Tax=Salinibacter ruber TaxID=146919 RepID=A0AAW5P777_9BACT|nr:hypothetical protein [Salinibacter ruber]
MTSNGSCKRNKRPSYCRSSIYLSLLFGRSRRALCRLQKRVCRRLLGLFLLPVRRAVLMHGFCPADRGSRIGVLKRSPLWPRRSRGGIARLLDSLLHPAATTSRACLLGQVPPHRRTSNLNVPPVSLRVYRLIQTLPLPPHVHLRRLHALRRQPASDVPPANATKRATSKHSQRCSSAASNITACKSASGGAGKAANCNAVSDCVSTSLPPAVPCHLPGDSPLGLLLALRFFVK